MGDSVFGPLLNRLAGRSVPVEVSPELTVRVVGEEDLVEAMVGLSAGGQAGSGPGAAGSGEDAADSPVDGGLTRLRRGLEIATLRAGMSPRRYLRNLGTLGLEGQARLLEASVGVAGLGGLGGTIAELLARAGVGELVLVDPDTISEDNLNRQILATERNVGRTKVEAARERLALVNSAVSVATHRLRAEAADFTRLFRGTSVAVDALDNMASRFALQDAAAALGLPFVHGAIAGLSGQVATIFPGDPGLEALYGPRNTTRDRGVETVVGNPSPTPAMVAAVQAQEVVKLISGVGRPLRRRLLLLDALTGYAAVVEL